MLKLYGETGTFYGCTKELTSTFNVLRSKQKLAQVIDLKITSSTQNLNSYPAYIALESFGILNTTFHKTKGAATIDSAITHL